MTDIEQMAREVAETIGKECIQVCEHEMCGKMHGHGLEFDENKIASRISDAIRAAVDDEREACAKTADSVIGTRRGEIAAAIRARAQAKEKP